MTNPHKYTDRRIQQHRREIDRLKAEKEKALQNLKFSLWALVFTIFFLFLLMECK